MTKCYHLLLVLCRYGRNADRSIFRSHNWEALQAEWAKVDTNSRPLVILHSGDDNYLHFDSTQGGADPSRR